MPSSSPLRADAARNRESLLAVASHAFATAETEPSLRAIAREAGVGIGTLYRHFPTREALVDAVYRDQVQRLVVGAHELLADLTPTGALRRWMDLFAGWVAAKRGMLGILLVMIEAGQISHAQTRAELRSAITPILDAGRATGELRTDVDADDILAALVGIFTVADTPAKQAQAERLLNLLVDGLAPPQRRAPDRDPRRVR